MAAAFGANDGRMVIGRTIGHAQPEACATYIHAGSRHGHLTDRLFDAANTCAESVAIVNSG